MNAHRFEFHGVTAEARPSGVLWLPSERLLAVSDLHLGKSERIQRRGGMILPPYEVEDTLTRLQAEVEALSPQTVVCVGDSFDDLAAAHALEQPETAWLNRLMAGRRWIWVAGNHDPQTVPFPGTQMGEFLQAGLVFRHIAEAGAHAEISGHYHPKAGLRGGGRSRPCFLIGQDRIILPAFGTYTGGLHAGADVMRDLMCDKSIAVLTGARTVALPYAALI